jgi:four helix bundle protein
LFTTFFKNRKTNPVISRVSEGQGKLSVKLGSFAFGLMIVEVCRHLKDSRKEYILYRQLLRSGTAVGALIREAEFAQSKADFVSKLSIALKEANETEYWLELLIASESLEKETHKAQVMLVKELIKMLVASINTMKANTPH